MKRNFSSMEWHGLMLGAVGGLFGTLVMSAIEVIPWRKLGLTGVFEWHENQMLIVKFLRLEHDDDDAHLQYLGIFGLHLTNGLLGGIGFYFAIEYIDRLLGNPTSATFRNSIQFLSVYRYTGTNS